MKAYKYLKKNETPFAELIYPIMYVGITHGLSYVILGSQPESIDVQLCFWIFVNASGPPGWTVRRGFALKNSLYALRVFGGSISTYILGAICFSKEKIFFYFAKNQPVPYICIRRAFSRHVNIKKKKFLPNN